MYRVRVRWLGLAILIAGCGDNSSPCDYSELDDVSNGTTAEPAGVVIDGVRDVCGTVEGGHYDGATSTIDVDRFAVTMPADGTVLVRIASPADATPLSRVSARIFDATANPRLLADIPLTGDHGAQLVALAAGDYVIAVTATASGDLEGTLPYRVQLVANPECAAATFTAYAETAADNDAIAIDFTATPTTSAMTGTAEATGLTATANTTLHIAGSADGTAHTDSYADRDSFAFVTDDTANELTVRLDWPDAAADLDFYVFDGNLNQIAAGDLGKAGAQEMQTFAVQPGTAYTLWVGGFKGTHAPATYDATVCGTHFFH